MSPRIVEEEEEEDQDQADDQPPPAILRGLLTFTLAKPSRIKRIGVKVRGEAKTEWPEGELDISHVASKTRRFCLLKCLHVSSFCGCVVNCA